MNFVFQRCLRRLATALTLASLLALPFSALAQERPTDYQVKAAFLEKFGKFVEWPRNAFTETNAPLVIGIFGDNPFQNALETIAAKDSINGRHIEIIQIKTMSDLQGCHIVFIPTSEKARERDVLNTIKDRALPVLTVGETDDFYRVGGMIQFVIEDTQVHFRIDNSAARDAGLKISSKLLSLAKP